MKALNKLYKGFLFLFILLVYCIGLYILGCLTACIPATVFFLVTNLIGKFPVWIYDHLLVSFFILAVPFFIVYLIYAEVANAKRKKINKAVEEFRKQKD